MCCSTRRRKAGLPGDLGLGCANRLRPVEWTRGPVPVVPIRKWLLQLEIGPEELRSRRILGWADLLKPPAWHSLRRPGSLHTSPIGDHGRRHPLDAGPFLTPGTCERVYF